MEPRVIVPASVLEGLEAVRLSGKTNMLDVPEVIRIARDMGFADAAEWIENNRSLYCQALLRGLEAVDNGGDN